MKIRVKEYMKKLWERQGLRLYILLILNSAAVYYALEVGNKNPFGNGLYSIINILTVFAVQSLLYVVVRRHFVAAVATSLVSTVLAVANYYTVVFRNQPISTQDIHNVRTAMNVLGSYKPEMNLYVLTVLLLFVLSLGIAYAIRLTEKKRKLSLGKKIGESFGLLGGAVVFMFVSYFSPCPIKPNNTFGWSWEETYYKYGYLASSIEVMQNSINPVQMPEGYSDEAAESALRQVEESRDGGETPDVIFILNETFYDVRDALDIETDAEIMPFIDSGKNMIRGRAVIPGTGGGTNRSEYELLTANSLQLMQGITPFNFLNLKGASSVVSHMESLGYETWAGHPASSLNYSRGVAYPALGFDTVCFQEEFGDFEMYGNRWYMTDSTAYDVMMKEYEKMGDGPRMMYLLTIQNHGDWNLNPDSDDIVHSKTDFGEYTDDINEFISCIRKSDEAFEGLTERFEGSDRRVVICMVGDHCPSFLPSVVKGDSLERAMTLRSTPYVIWANFPIEENGEGEEIALPFLVPKTLEAAEVTLSPYYEYILDLSERVPVVSAFGVYRGRDGKLYDYGDDTEYKKEIDGYFNLLYNNAGKKAKKLEKAFLPYETQK